MVEGWYIIPVTKPYYCGKYFINHTRAVQISNTANILPTHSRIPSISKENDTIIATEEIFKVISKKLGAEDILKHKKVIQQLTSIITNKPP